MLILRCILLNNAGLCFFWTVKIGQNSTIQRLKVNAIETRDKWCGYCLLSHPLHQRWLAGVKLLTLTYLLCSVTSLKASTKTWMGETQAFATKKLKANANINRADKEESFLEIHSQKWIFEMPLNCPSSALFVLSPFVIQTCEAAEGAEGGGRFMKLRNRSRRFCRFCTTTTALRIKLTHNRVTLWPLERSDESPVECFE